MKPFFQMEPPDRAKQLHQLFPEHIPGLLDFMSAMAETVLEYETPRRSDDPSVEPDQWQKMAGVIINRIHQLRNTLEVNSARFADSLFCPELVKFTLYCVLTYCTAIKHPDPKFTACLQFYFF